MSIERGIRFALAKPYNTYQVLMEDQESHIPLRLSTKRGGDFFIDEFVSPQDVPDFIVLRGRLKGIRKPLPNVRATLQVDDIHCTPCDFYGRSSVMENTQSLWDNSRYTSIQMIYENYGYALKKGVKQLLPQLSFGDIEENGPLYEHIFPYESAAELQQIETLISSGNRLIQAPWAMGGTLNDAPLLAYGGFYAENTPLENITPVFAVLTPLSSTHTKIALQTHQAPVANHHGAVGLKEALIKGAVRIQIEWEEWPTPIAYQSVEACKSAPDSNLIDLTFKRVTP